MDLKVTDVYAAARHKQTVAEAPSAVTIVTGEEIKLYGHRTLADVLRSVRGIYVSYDRNYSYIGVRGFNRPGDYNTRVLLLVDGHRLNDALQDTASIGTEFPIDVDLIDRVEVIRGPGSALYGNSAFYGVINVITRQGHQVNGAEISGEAGSFETYKGRFTYGGKFTNEVELLLSGSYYSSRGPARLYFREFDDPATNNGVAERSDDDQFHNLFGVLSYHDFTLSGAYSSRQKRIPTASFGTLFNDRRNRTFDDRAYLDLKFERSFPDAVDVAARVYHDDVAYDGDYAYASAVPPPATYLNKDHVRGEWWGGELQLSRNLWDRLTVTGGAEVRDNVRLLQQNFNDLPGTGYLLNDRRTSVSWGVFAQSELAIVTNLVLTMGLRYDAYATFGDNLNPRAALVYTPWGRTTIKALYGQAFRAPNFYELYYNDGYTSSKPSPDLHAESIRTYELILEQRLNDMWSLEGSIFYNQIRDLISQRVDPGDGLLQFVNLDRAEARGAEVELEGRWADGFRGRASYTWQNAVDGLTGEHLARSPRHLGRLNLIAPVVADRLFANLEIQYSGAARTISGGKAGEFWLANATLFSQKLARGLELSASVYNLFDRRYGYPGAEEHVQDVIRQDGRTFRVKLTWHF